MMNIAQLRDLLAHLYPTSADLRRVASDAGLEAAYLELTGKGINDWHGLVQEADKRGLLNNLRQRAALEYPNHAEKLLGNPPPTPQIQPPQAPQPPILHSSTVVHPAAESFDVFLAYNSKDKPAIQQLRLILEANHLSAWLDNEDLSPVIMPQQGMEIGITSSKSTAVIVGEHGIGPWQKEEINFALHRAVTEEHLLLTVLLPGCNPNVVLPAFLRTRRILDFRAGITEEGLKKLIWGITGQKRRDIHLNPSPDQPPIAKVSSDHPFVNSLGMRFVPVPIPGGKPLLFCVWLTRVKDFEAFVKDTGHDATKEMYSYGKDGWGGRGNSWKNPGFDQTPEHPVCGVSFEDANAFCEWLSKKEGMQYRLPTDHEWSCAVGIGDREKATDSPEAKAGKIEDVYPWGTQWPPPKGAGNYAGEECKGAPGLPKDFGVIKGYKDRYVFTSPVGSFDANKFGLYDLGGNLWEWCDSAYDGNDSDKTARRVLRGASWSNSDRGTLRSSYRNCVQPTFRSLNLGFRCVVVAVP